MMQPPAFNHNDEGMSMDDAYDNSQEQTQATQQATQPINGVGPDSHIWGYLQPCRHELPRVDFFKINPTVTIGRNKDANDFVLPGFKVSNRHCKIIWDGKEDASTVLAIDLSSNGTFINGEKIGQDLNKVSILRDGNEIAFGTCLPQQNHMEDYRYIFRFIASGPPRYGLHAVYDISHELGKGSFATVFKAVYRQTGEWFAVKMIHNNRISRNETNPQRKQATTSFTREIAILESLQHPNICALKEVFFDENINLVLEYVDGGDLLEFIIRQGGLDEEMAKHVTYQICDALAYIHGKGIAHRDLKPENVLLTSHDPPIVKVADFGLAKVVDSMTMLRTMCGTPSYLAPEVVMQTNQQGYDHVVDSWSVGVIVFSMLTNSNPFIEDENADMKTRISTRKIDWPTLQHAGVSAEAQHFIQRLLDPKPTYRMTLKDAMQHPWLKSHVPLYGTHHQSSDDTRGDASMLVDSNSEFIVDQDMGQMQIGGSNGGIRRQGSALMRRSEVVSRAAQGEGPELPQPSDEMLYTASQQATGVPDPNELAPANNNKRKVHPLDSELTPLSEEDEQELPKRRSSSDSDGHSPNGNGKKGRGKKRAGPYPAAPRTRAQKAAVASEDDEEPQKPRRSSRQTPQKVARRA